MKTRKSPSAHPAGHADHTKPADIEFLPGKFTRPVKITLLGAGSTFTHCLANDIFRMPDNLGGTLALVDIDASRLRAMRRVVGLLAAHLKAGKWKIVASTDRAAVLAGSDYVINCIEVSGLECVRHDNDIPAKYGIDQCIGDTAGPGGLFKALRTIPVWLDILRDCERLCPRALVMNYTNPMGMLCLAASRATSMRVIGLCHSVQGTSHLLAKRAGVPYPELEWECAGINHLAWFTKLRHKGRDLYPELMRKAREDLAGTPSDPDDAWDLVRKDVMLHFGAFVTESSGHLSEYLPYYRKRKDLVERFMREGYHGASRFYVENWPFWRDGADKHRRAILRGEVPLEKRRSWEFASWIIEAREKDSPFRMHGNVPNRAGGSDALIANLPADGIVEVACFIDRNGWNPSRFGSLPPQMAALCASNMPLFDLGATAAITRSKEAAIHALLLDPLTAAVLSPSEIRDMTLELFEAEADFLPDYK